MDDYAERQQICSWSNLLFNSILIPCCGCKCLPFYNLFNTPSTICTVIGTIICPVGSSGKVKLYLQKDLGSFPFILLDLPLEVSEFAKLIHVGTTRVVLSRAYDSCSISIVQWWLMQCNGKQKGIAVKRQMSPKDKYLLDMIQAVSTGAGFLPCKESSGGGGYKYLRCRFQHTVGSDGSEGYHLIDPSNCFHQADLSFFFVRH